MNKLALTISFFLLLVSELNAQIMKKETLGINGLSAFVYSDSNRGYFIQQSIGQQSVIKTFDRPDYSLRQGFLQPINPLLINHRFDNNLDAIVYPNPFEDAIKIKFFDPINRNILVRVFDISGRLVFKNEYPDDQDLDVIVNNLSSGIYLLRVDSENKFYESKLMKR